jgi:DNA-binding transcriptional regulator YdaS (Cro superfamily)
MNDHLRDWLASATADRRQLVAEAAKTTVGHLWQLAGGHRKASAELAERLQDASDGEITIAGLRPDLIELAHKVLRVAETHPKKSAA